MKKKVGFLLAFCMVCVTFSGCVASFFQVAVDPSDSRVLHYQDSTYHQIGEYFSFGDRTRDDWCDDDSWVVIGRRYTQRFNIMTYSADRENDPAVIRTSAGKGYIVYFREGIVPEECMLNPYDAEETVSFNLSQILTGEEAKEWQLVIIASGNLVVEFQEYSCLRAQMRFVATEDAVYLAPVYSEVIYAVTEEFAEMLTQMEILEELQQESP